MIIYIYIITRVREYAYVICILCIARRVRLLGVASMHVLIHTTSGVVLIASSMYTLVV